MNAVCNSSAPRAAVDDATTAAVETAADAFIYLESCFGSNRKARRACASAIRAVVRVCCPELGRKTRDDAAFLAAARTVPMDCTYLNGRLYRASPAAIGLPPRCPGERPRRFENAVSLLRGVLRRMGRHAPALPRACGLAPAWRRRHAALPKHRRNALIAFMGYCTREGIAPEEVDNGTLDAFEAWSVAWTLHRDPHGRARRTASNWNWAARHIEEWSPARLERPGMRDEYSPPLKAYPASFQEDVEKFLARLACTDEREIFPDDVAAPRTKSPRSRRQPLSPRTVETRADQIRWAAAALVETGHPPESLRTVRDLVQPAGRVRDILAFHRRRALDRRGIDADAAGAKRLDVRTTHLAGIADAVRQIAVHHFEDSPEGPLPEADVARITAWANSVAPKPRVTMTDKNMRRLRALVEPRNYALLLHYPEALMKRAASVQAGGPEREPNPRAAALLAMYAVTLEILTVCPLRRDNLAGLRLDRHLRRARPGGLVGDVHLAAEEVKNAEAGHWPLAPGSARLVEEYLRKHRPHLAEPGNPFLFPGRGQRGRGAQDLAIGLTGLVEREIGVEFNPHLMRHFAVLLYLRAHPGQYEVVRRILGHRKVETTKTFYAGLEGAAAAGRHQAVVCDERRATRLLAAGAFAGNRRGPAGA